MCTHKVFAAHPLVVLLLFLDAFKLALVLCSYQLNFLNVVLRRGGGLHEASACEVLHVRDREQSATFRSCKSPTDFIVAMCLLLVPEGLLEELFARRPAEYRLPSSIGGNTIVPSLYAYLSSLGSL